MDQFISHLPAAQRDSVYRKLKALIASKAPRAQAAVKKANLGLLACKDVAGTIHVNSALSNLSVQYRNEDFIGLDLMPLVTVGVPSADYFIYRKRDRLATPDDSVGGRSLPNEVSENRDKGNFSVKDYALRDFVSEKTLKSQDAPLNEMVDLIASVNDAIAFREEKRIAAVLTTAANYGGNTAALTGNDQWSAYTQTASDPIEDIENARDQVWSGQGPSRLVAFCGLAVWNKLKHHPKLLAEFKHQGGMKALTRQQVADYFELDDLLVSKAWEDTMNEGQAAAYGRIWGKHFGIVRVATTPGIRTASFGYTFRHGEKKTTQWYDAAPGVDGGYWGKVGLSEDHKIVAADCGYLLTDVIA